MANNPYVNKVVYGNSTVMDISDTTAEESDVANGKTFYKASGAKGVGTAVTPDISNCYQSTDNQETDIQDADYFPFYDSSATAKRNTLWSNIKAKLKTYFDTLYATFLGVSGLIETTVGWSTKNILNCDIASGTQTINGLTVNVSRTTGGDLIYVKVSGTATANTNIQVASSVSDDEYNELTGGKYILNGCPSGGSSSTYSLLISGGYGGYTDTGSGVLISSTVTNAKVYIVIKNGYTANNLQFKPMIRSRYVDDDTYEAFSPNVKDSKFDRAEQRVLGAKNLLPYPYQAGSSYTANGITHTVNSDGSIKLNGTATADTDFRLFTGAFPKGDYILSQKNTNSLSGIIIEAYNGNTYVKSIIGSSTFSTDNKSFSIDYNGYDTVRVSIRTKNTAVLSNFTIYPMIRLASDPDDTYAPYAMTNRELTEKVETVYKVAQANSSGDTVIFYNVDTSKAYDLEVDLGTSWDGAIPCATNCKIQGTTVTYTLQNAQAGQSFRLIDLKR